MVNEPLMIDCGNTRIKARLGDQDFVFADQADLSEWIKNHAVQSIVYADVSRSFQLSPQLSKQLREVIPVNVEPGFQGLTLAYRDSQRLGVDRWLAMLGALRRQDGNGVIVVDAGTALKVDVIDSDRKHVGGSIGPGLALSSESLASNTAQLQEVVIKTDGQLGRDTGGCINYGIVIGAVALIEHTMLKFCPEGTLLVSGGDRAVISQHLSVPHELIDNLVLDGLKAYTEHRIAKVFK